MNRVVTVMKLQYVNRKTYISMPLIILSGAFLLAIPILFLVPTDELKFAGGAVAAPLWYFSVVGWQALALTFPFSQAMSTTRRDFHLGTLLTAATTAGILATFYLVISLIEAATGGWGMNGYFTIPGLSGSQLPVAALSYFVVACLLFLFGYTCAAIAKRWGGVVLTSVLTGLSIVLALAIILVIRSGSWGTVVTWFVTQGLLGTTLWGLLLAVLMAYGSYLMIRRVEH